MHREGCACDLSGKLHPRIITAVSPPVRRALEARGALLRIPKPAPDVVKRRSPHEKALTVASVNIFLAHLCEVALNLTEVGACDARKQLRGERGLDRQPLDAVLRHEVAVSDPPGERPEKNALSNGKQRDRPEPDSVRLKETVHKTK